MCDGYPLTAGAPTGVHTESRPALRATASSTCCTPYASANDGLGSVPSATAARKSRAWWVKLCS